MRTLIVGHGGREAALAWKMSESSELYAFMGHENPSIIEYVKESGGSWAIGDVLNGKSIAEYAAHVKIDLAFVSSDEPLAAGVVDELLAKGILTVGPTKSGAEIEWNKEFSRQIVNEVAPEANPFFIIIQTKEELENIFEKMSNERLVIKPLGLTGGKGVKVMGPHLKDLSEAKSYAQELLTASNESKVIIEEYIDGVEFTIQAISDGKSIVFPPATYDYPYRYDGDSGPGTGGMGSFCVNSNNLPFISLSAYEKAAEIIRKVISRLDKLGRNFNGVLNSGFFLTKDGDVKVIEFNARFGDPECLNIMSILDVDLVSLLMSIHNKSLDINQIYFNNKCSIVSYLVTPEYANGSASKKYEFSIDVNEIRKTGAEVLFSASQLEGDKYYSVGNSRVVAILVAEPTLDAAYKKLHYIQATFLRGELEWRTDIGSKEYIDKLIGKMRSVL